MIWAVFCFALQTSRDFTQGSESSVLDAQERSKQRAQQFHPLGDRPESFSWRKQAPQCFEPTRAVSGKCDSSWAFIAVYQLQDAACALNAVQKAQNHSVDQALPYQQLSAQYLVSCSLSCEKCGGCGPIQATMFLHNAGTVPESCFPYAGEELSCPFFCADGSELDVTRARLAEVISLYPTSDAMYQTLLEGPILCDMQIFADFFDYKGGVYQHSYGAFQRQETVEIVGYGTENGVDYWEARTALDSSFGDNGFFKIKRGSNECEIEQSSCARTIPWVDE